MQKSIKIALVAAAAIFVMGRLGWLAPVRDFTLWLTAPVVTRLQAATLSIVGTTKTIFALGKLPKENSRLQEQLALLQAENAQLHSALSNLADYEQALHLKEQTGWQLVGGQVISTDPQNLRQVVIVNRGSGTGLLEGQPAVDAYGFFIGRVSAVYRNTAEVTLLSDRSSRLSAEVIESGARGFLIGKHSLSVSLAEVPQDKPLPPGGRVVTTGFTPGVPAGLLVGFVETVTSSGADLFQEAHIKTAADLKQLRTVYIITGQ